MQNIGIHGERETVMLRIRTLTIVVLLLLATQVTQAQLLFNLNPAGLTGLPDSTVTFNATLTNAGSDTVWLNGDNITGLAPGFTFDDTPFFNNFPIFLVGGDAATSDLFTVTIDSAVAPGDYIGTFTVLGGLDNQAQNALAYQNFLVHVPAVPEPGSFAMLMGTAGFGMGLLVHRRRR